MKKKPGILAYLGLGVLGIIWLWLAWGLIAAKGVTLYNLLIIAMAGVIIFVPVYKKYFGAPSDHKDNGTKGML